MRSGEFGNRFAPDAGYVDVDTRVSRESYAAARMAAGAVVLAVGGASGVSGVEGVFVLISIFFFFLCSSSELLLVGTLFFSYGMCMGCGCCGLFVFE